MPRGRTALFSPTAAAIAVFALYLATAARDVGSPGLDSAKFGYMGRILGVPHPPGYPLYLLAGWLWSWLPIGSLMFRMSVFSAVSAAVTVWLLAAILELLGCRRTIAVAAAVLAGAGRIFWSQAIIPEVYSLHTALFLGTIAGLLVWQRAGDVRPLFLASLTFGLDLAHHTDVAVLAPAILVFVIVARPSVFRSPRTLVVCAALVLSPLLLYAYIIIRTRQGAPYVEAGATTFVGLVNVVSGRQFGYLLFRGSLADALRDRWMDLGRFFTQEMGWWGCALAVVGLVVLWRRDRRAALLIGLGLIGVLLFVLNYYPPDIEVFLLPAFLLCWVGIGVAADQLARSGGRATAIVAVVMAVWVPWQVAANATVNNLRPASFDARLFNRLLADMPDGSAIVGDSIDLSQDLLYKLFAEPAVAAKRPTLVVPGEFGATRVFGFVRSTPERPVVIGDPANLDRLAAERPAVYAFARLADPLRAQGFRLDPVRLPDRSLGAHLAALDRGLVVAVAVPAAAAPAIFWRHPFASIGGADATVSSGQCYAAIGVTGDSGGSSSIGAVGRVEVHRGDPIGPSRRPAPVAIVAECGPAGASLVVDGREIARSEAGVPMAAIGPAGEIVDETMAAPAMGYEVPFEWRWQPIYRVAAPRRCAAVSGTDRDVTVAASQGALAISMSGRSKLSLVVGSDVPLRVRAAPFSRRAASIVARPGSPPHGLGANGDAAVWTRIDVIPIGPEDDVIDVMLGAPARAATASLELESLPASVCAAPLGNFPVLAGSLDGSERVIADGSREDLFGDGWHPVEADDRGGFRWTSSARAHVLVPLAVTGRIRVSLRARQPPGPGDGDTIGLSVNGARQRALPLAAGWGTYEWALDGSLWRDGLNDLVVESSRVSGPSESPADTRKLGVAVREISFTLDGVR